MTIDPKLAGVAAALALIGLSGCSFYNYQHDTADYDGDDYSLRIVQADDFGTFWDIDKPRNVLREVEKLANDQNVLVVVFIHGWHHNAAADDMNLLDFRQTLKDLGDVLRTKERRALRGKLTTSEDLKILGIYIGWRGRSLPGVLDYATMWWRKSAAERVGDGDVSEFIERLDRTYLRRNALVMKDVSGVQKHALMGLVTIGHSFGGQVLLRSIARALEYSLVQRAPCAAELLDPSARAADRVDERVSVDSLGDLNILVNPATEAYQFARIDALYRQLNYPDSQTPQLVVFSADNDIPRKSFFPIARVLTRPFRTPFRSDFDDYQATLWGRALGEVARQQTHILRLAAEGSQDSFSNATYEGAGQDLLLHFDFSMTSTFAGVTLEPVANPGTGERSSIPNSPVIVATSVSNIIDGHNGIFGEEFRKFLIGYVSFIEGKRILLRAEQHRELRPHRSAEVAAKGEIEPVCGAE